MELPANQSIFYADRANTLLHARWQCLISQGVMLISVGLLAIALPVATTLGIELVIGSLLLVSGAWRTIAHLRADHPGFGWHLAISVMAVVLGSTMLIVPAAGIRTLTGLLFAFFVLEAIGKIIFAFGLRDQAREWVWPLLAGTMDFSLAVLIVSGWPWTTAWTIGLLVGINMMLFGSTLTVIGLAGRRARSKYAPKIIVPDRRDVRTQERRAAR